MYSLLKEVNKVLSLLSLPLVDDTTLTTSREAITVTNKLEEVKEELLQNGWNFNTRKREFIPTVTGEIFLTNVFAFRYRNNRYNQVDGKLYDNINKTFIFEDPVTIDVIEDMNIEDCPIYFINLVTAQTAWELRSTLGGNRESLLSSLQDNWIRYKAIAVQQDINEQGLNYGNYITGIGDSNRWNKYFTTFSSC